MREALRSFTLERALQLSIVLTIVTAVLAAGSIVSWLDEARKLRWLAFGAFVALSLASAYRRRRGPRPVGVYAAAGAFLALAFVSAAWSSFVEDSVGRATALALLLGACSALAFATAARPDAMRGVLGAVLAGCGAVAVGGLLVLAFAHDRAVEEATTALPSRYQGLGGGPNTATMVLAVGMPLAAFFVLEGRSPLVRALSGSLFVLLAGSIVASGSRGALIAGFGGLLAFALLVPRTARHRLAAGAIVVALAAVGLLVSRVPKPLKAGAVAPSGAPPALAPETTAIPTTAGYLDANQLLRLQDDVGHPPFGVADTQRRPRTLTGSSGRTEAWKGAIEQAAERPLLGYGFGTEPLVFVDRYVGFNSNVPENSYVGLLLQLGLAGLAAFLALLGAIAARAVTAFPRLGERELRIAAAAAGGLVVGLILAFFQSYVYAVGNNATAAVWICAFVLVAATTPRAANASA